MGVVSPKRDHTIRTPETGESQRRKTQKNYHSTNRMVGTDKQNDILMGQGRYASAKKTRKDVRPVSLVDMQHRRDVESLQKRLYQ